MKKRIDAYTFDKVAKTITLTGYTTIDLDAILLITNVTSNIILYNFADPTYKATVLTNVITLAYDTSGMANTDNLQIWYDDAAGYPMTVAELQTAVVPLPTGASKEDTMQGFLFLYELLQSAILNPNYYNPVTNKLGIEGTVAISGMSGTNTITTVTGLTNIGGLSADQIAINCAAEMWGITTRGLLI